MAKRTPSRDSTQQARKSAGSKRLSSSLAIIQAALPEAPLPKRRRTDDSGTNVQKDNTPAVSKSIVPSRPVERPSTRPPSLSASVSSARISPDSAPSSDTRSDEIGDSYYGNIVDLFARRYLATFDKDRLALEDAYASEATFSCRFISNSNSPLPYCFAKCNTGTLRGPTSIVQALSSFSRQILFVPGPELLLNVAIDVLRLSDMNYFASLTFNTIIEGVSVSVDMAFLLKERARHSAKQDLSRVLWTPFVVMSHQIILRS